MKDYELYDWIVANPKLAQLKESSSHPGLAVAKYKRKVFYDDLWNRQLEECRGAVFDMESKLSRVAADGFWYATREYNSRAHAALVHRFTIRKMVRDVYMIENAHAPADATN